MVRRDGFFAVANFVGQQHTAVTHGVVLYMTAAGVFGNKFVDDGEGGR